ncbi:MAG: hypothetical protein GVY23_00335 [Spirochaetes bacterium]|jgi:hypothetical protein|nr:hypothetical protein [Spirochaetota bacterium]
MIGKTRKVARYGLVFFATLAVLLSGCTTVDRDQPVERNVIGFEIETDDEVPNAEFGIITVVIESVGEQPIRRTLIAHPRDTFATVDGLPAGEYRVTRMSFWFAGSGMREQLTPPADTVSVGNTPVAVFPAAIVFGSSGECRHADIRDLPEDEIVNLEKELLDTLELNARRISLR